MCCSNRGSASPRPGKGGDITFKIAPPPGISHVRLSQGAGIAHTKDPWESLGGDITKCYPWGGDIIIHSLTIGTSLGVLIFLHRCPCLADRRDFSCFETIISSSSLLTSNENFSLHPAICFFFAEKLLPYLSSLTENSLALFAIQLLKFSAPRSYRTCRRVIMSNIAPLLHSTNVLKIYVSRVFVNQQKDFLPRGFSCPVLPFIEKILVFRLSSRIFLIILIKIVFSLLTS